MTITIGDRAIHRIGYGAMRITGPGMFGPPLDLPGALATLRSLRELGVTLVDTANAYGPYISEALVREALHPYDGLLIATKGGVQRPAPFEWAIDCRPEALRLAVQGSLKLLAVERIELWQLHGVDPKVPAGEQFGAIAEMQRAGLIHHVGICNVTVEQIELARQQLTIATVQNRYHVIDRGHEAVVDYCEREHIPFIAYFPLATGALAATDSVLARTAAKIGITPAQAALAWLLRRSPNLVVIPGTTRPEHARENVAAGTIELTDEQFAEIERVGKKAAMLRTPQ